MAVGEKFTVFQRSRNGSLQRLGTYRSRREAREAVTKLREAAKTRGDIKPTLIIDPHF